MARRNHPDIQVVGPTWLVLSITRIFHLNKLCLWILQEFLPFILLWPQISVEAECLINSEASKTLERAQSAPEMKCHFRDLVFSATNVTDFWRLSATYSCDRQWSTGAVLVLWPSIPEFKIWLCHLLLMYLVNFTTWEIWLSLGIQNVVYEWAATTSAGNLLQMQNLSSYPRPAKQELAF